MTATTPTPIAAATVTALVVAADSGPWLERCVAALLASADVAAVRLADNASRDGVPQAVAAAHADDARLGLHVNVRNLGFGAAMNLLAQAATTPWLLLVNPDCELAPDALLALLAAAAATPDAGLVGALIETADGAVDPASCRRDPTLARVLASFGLRRGEGIHAPWPALSPGSTGSCGVEAVSGALMLVRREVFESVGGFDAGYFLHFEDLDLCRRVRDAGWRVVLVPGVRARHAKGSSSHHRAAFVAWHKHRGLWRWLGKFDPALRNPLVAAAAWCGIWAHFVVMLPLQLARSWRGRRP